MKDIIIFTSNFIILFDKSPDFCYVLVADVDYIECLQALMKNILVFNIRSVCTFHNKKIYMSYYTIKSNL